MRGLSSSERNGPAHKSTLSVRPNSHTEAAAQRAFARIHKWPVPPPSEGNEEVATMEILIESSGESISESSKVLVKRRTNTFIQTDKAVYEPGDTVRFRVVSLKENLQPGEKEIPVIQIQDPKKNPIAQWLNVTLKQGIAELSLPLSSKPFFGYYFIHVGGTKHSFSLDEYALSRFEVTFQFPKAVLYNIERFQLKTCGRYTYGKPVQGTYTATVCRKAKPYWLGRYTFRTDRCVHFSGKLDHSGCSTMTVNSLDVNLPYYTHEMSLEGTSTITEEGTGKKYSGSGRTPISSRIRSCSFLDADTSYKPGIPYSGTVKVVDPNDEPLPNHVVYLTSYCRKVNEILVSDKNGLATFKLNNTAEWEGKLLLTASPSMEDTKLLPFKFFGITPDFWGATLNLTHFFSPSKSFLKLHSLQGVLPCDGQRDAQVEYIIQNSALGMDAKHMELHYLIVSKGVIKNSGSVEVPITHEGEVLRGEVSIKLTLSADVSPTLRALVFIFLPNGELAADSTTFKLQRCFKNKVSVGFAPDEVLPGSDLSLQVEAAAGSLCGLRVVDKSVVLMKPDQELTADKIHNLFPFLDYGGYDIRVHDGDDYGSFYPCFQRTTRLNSHSYIPNEDFIDVYSLFKDMRFKIVTSAEIKKPLRCHQEPEVDVLLTGTPTTEPGAPTTETFRIFPPLTASPKLDKGENEITESADEIIRAYVPETWIWALAWVGDNGKTEFHRSAPDTITDWTAGAFCMGPSGFGISPPSSLRVFQSFLVELTLPYSVVRGETFTLKASVFNYLKECIKVQTTLQSSLELEEEPCADCQYSSCVCAEESETFYWNLKASKLGDVNITVRTEALNTQDMCNNEIPIESKQRNINTVIKPLRVQPGGVLVEKSHSSLICSQEGEEHSKNKNISLKVPENTLKDSESAYITALGDIMGTAMQNLDHLLAMPYGCGEQNMVLFASNIFILQYLENTHQLSLEIQSKAKNLLEIGYQRQLTYKKDDGSYSAFRSWLPEGNTWLTAFVVKSFNKAYPYIFIDGDQLSHSITWLKDNRKISGGCFRTVGKLFNNAMKGGVDDEISLSAYVTIALMEADLPKQDPVVVDALSCLRKAAQKVSSIYTQALIAYTFTLSGDTELREMLLDKLDEKAVRNDGQLHWERKSVSEASNLTYWYQAPSAEVELTSYVLLALLSGPNKDLGKASEIVNWLSKQQNPYGGFSSTQDTVVALQALAKYAEATFTDKGDVTVTVSSKTGFHQQFHVDHTNRLLLQKSSLPDIPGEFSLSVTGSGCVYVQTVLRYNIPPPKSDTTFSVRVETQPKQCPQDPMKQMRIDIYIQYTGSREKSNMAVVEVKMLSGFIPDKRSLDEVIIFSNIIKQREIQTDMVMFYLNELGHNPINFFFMVEQDIVVKNLKPAIVKVYDYYETAEHSVTEYNSPCSSVQIHNNFQHKFKHKSVSGKDMSSSLYCTFGQDFIGSSSVTIELSR
ncbi:hypothetical protein XELAEV_18034310mg [Xenopus laevis]|uniref:Alpha-2-macroglobulin-like protein 1 n=1 Tax=Xenopus laevis TaxID=8355 RepID=A0A974CES4_XENLA|nr:hypothetical protein XELAEV_18034310mg [Xenopus laevis]